MAYLRNIDTYTVVETYKPFKMADGNYLMNIDLMDNNGSKVHTVAYQNRCDVSGVTNLVNYIENLPLMDGSKVLAKIVNTSNETTQMLTYLALPIKEFK